MTQILNREANLKVIQSEKFIRQVWPKGRATKRIKPVQPASTKSLKRQIYVLSALLPFLVMFFVFMALGVYPFGRSTVMAIDFASQYIDLFAYLKRAVLSLDFSSFFYSFSKSLGGDMVGLWGYYLLSPFNIFYVLVPVRYITVAAALTILGRYAAMGASFAFLLIKRYRGLETRPFLVPLFATLYALSGFAVAYQMNPLWYDALWVLPLVIAFAEDALVGKKQGYWYIFWLALMMLIQYYMAYMMSLFIILYACYFSARFWGGQTLKDKLLAVFKPLVRLALYSFLAVGIACVLLYPIVQNLLITKGTYTELVYFKWELTFNPLELFSKLMIGAFDYEQMPNGLPNIYLGSLALIGLVIFFVNKGIKRDQKIGAAVVLGIFLLSMVHDFSNKIWHLMQTPAWFYHRFSYLTCFFMVLLAYQGVKGLTILTGREVLAFLAFALLAQVTSFFLPQSFMNWQKQALSALFWGLTLYLLWGKWTSRRWLFLLLLTLGELGLNAYLVQSSIGYADAIAFQNAYEVQKAAIDPIRPSQDDFYRIGKMYNRTKNDPFMFDFPGLTNFSSTMEASTLDLFDAMGDAGSNAATNYGAGTPLTDALYSVRYMVQMRNLAGTDLNNPDIYSFTRETTRKDLYTYYQAIYETPRLRVYENKNVLPIAFGVSDNFVNLVMGVNQPVQNQEKILSAMKGDQDSLYFYSDTFDAILLDNFKTDNPSDLTSVALSRIDSSQPAKITYRFTAQSNDAYYISLPATLNKSKNDLKITLNGQVYEYYQTFDHRQLWNIAANQKGETITFEIETDSLDQINIFNVQLYHLDEEAVRAAIASRASVGLQVTHWRANAIDGTIDISDDSSYLMTSIPYSPGWQAYVDGTAVTPIKVWGALMALPISSGQHSVRLVYMPVGWYAGVAVSALSLVIFGVLVYWKRRPR